MRPIISVEELGEQIQNTILVDCRFDLSSSYDGAARYRRGHLPGALYVSLETDLSAYVRQHGGRHPLPSVEEMTAVFSRLGIERGKSTVVAYDDEGGCYAARLWWMLRYCGHENVRVLDGGFSAWKRNGGEVTKDASRGVHAVFVPEVQEHLLVTMEEVRERNPSELLVDCRAQERFSGHNETIDPKAGHIPGAFNVPWQELVETSGRFRSVGHLAEQLTAVDERSIMYCGSGVTACVNILAAEQAALGVPRLYAGSWSDWITWDENEIVTGR